MQLDPKDIHHALTVVLTGIKVDKFWDDFNHVEVTKDGNKLRFVSTDKYVLVRYTLELTDTQTLEPDFTAYFEANDIKAVLPLLKAAQSAVEFTKTGFTGLAGVDLDNRFPKNITRLIPDKDTKLNNVGNFALDLKHLARFTPAKLRYPNQAASYTEPLVIQTGLESHKAVRMDYGDRITILIMPIRMEN